MFVWFLYSVEEANTYFMKPFGLTMPKKASPPVICLEFPLPDGGRFVTCPYFCAIRNAEGKVVHSYTQIESPKRYELHGESHLLPNMANSDVETVSTKDEGALTQSSLLAVKLGLSHIALLFLEIVFHIKLSCYVMVMLL